MADKRATSIATFDDGTTPSVTKDDIVAGLRKMGIEPGDLVVVHSSLSAFGHVEGGAEGVIAALMETVGDKGTLLVPSFTGVHVLGVPLYDPKSTPVRRDIGIISDTFWRMPNTLRGRHPPRTPFAAVGPLAAELIALHESKEIRMHHVDGVLKRVAELDGWILLLGCNHNSNTSVHAAQAAAVSSATGTVYSMADFLPNLDDIDPYLREAGVQKMGRIGNAEIRLMRSRDLFKVASNVYLRHYHGKPIKKSREAVLREGFPSGVEYQGVCRAMKALEAALGSVLDNARAGMTAKEVDAMLADALKPYGVAFMPDRCNPFLVAEGGKGPKLRVDRIPLEENALWGLDLTMSRDGYCADIGRYGFMGTPPDSLLEAHAEILRRQDEIAEWVKPGMTMDELFSAIPDGLHFAIHKIGPEPDMIPACGGMTPKGRERMRESVERGLVLEWGHVICIEIWNGLAGGIEDMYVVEQDGVRRLSSLPREIRAIQP